MRRTTSERRTTSIWHSATPPSFPSPPSPLPPPTPHPLPHSIHFSSKIGERRRQAPTNKLASSSTPQNRSRRKYDVIQNLGQRGGESERSEQ